MEIFGFLSKILFVMVVLSVGRDGGVVYKGKLVKKRQKGRWVMWVTDFSY